ncbi:unnamed protein product [Brassica oleracea]
MDLHSVAAWINQPRASSIALASSVMKLYFQSAVYVIWKERNARVFTATSTPEAVIISSLDRMMCDRLLSYPARSSSTSLLLFYLSSSASRNLYDVNGLVGVPERSFSPMFL